MRRTYRTILLVGAALAILVTGSGVPRPAAATELIPVCARPASPGPALLHLRSGGLERTVRVYVPRRYQGTRRVPLVLQLHGSGSSATGQEVLSGLDTSADAHTFVAAYPQGYRRTGAGYAWNVPGTPLPREPAARADDLQYLLDVVALLAGRYCVDAQRVYASGFSGGARMSSALACAKDTPLAGVAAVGGLRAPQPCAPGHPVAVVAFHGTADRSNPYAGHGEAYWTYSVPEAARRWAVANGCGLAAKVGHPYSDVMVSSYDGCTGGVAVRLYTLTGVGHRWPRPVLPRGADSQPAVTALTLDVNELLWGFFAGLVGAPR